MSTSATLPSKPEASAIPPEEQFWKRYSPHGEAPLSLTGSVALHVLAGGILALFGVWLASIFVKPTTTLPIEPVRFAGGGGHKGGKGDGKGVGGGPVEDTGGEENVSVPGLDKELPKLPNLKPVEKLQIEEKFLPADARYISESNNESARALARIEDGIRKKLSDGLQAGKGKGGTGEGGGKGKGVGTGEGDGSGAGRAKLTQREKRMLRWHMRFTANTGPEYLAQLRSLGAILAIPVKEGPNPEYELVEDLRPPAKLVRKDLAQIQRIYWIDDKPNSVRDILFALKLNMKPLPSRFVAFMPESLEEELFKMEQNYVKNVLKQRTFDEDKIDETHFRVVIKGGRYRPELENVTMRR